MKKRVNLLWPVIAAILASEATGIAFAQEAAAPQTTSESGKNLNVVVVTATKRAESAQEVPIALSAFTSEDLAVRGIQSPADLQRLVPSLSFGTQQNNPGITMDVAIRGVSSPNSLPGGDPGVPVHMNGHYLQAANFLARDLLDIERIEVLRGPQGTLYGRNANGGSVNIITKQPTNAFEGKVSIEGGNYDLFGLQAVVNIPLSESIRSRFVVANRYRQGYIDNVNPTASQRDLMQVDYISGRGQIDIDVNDDITARFGGYYYENTGELSAFQLTTFGPINTTGSAYYQLLPAGSRFQSDFNPRAVSYDQRLDAEDKAYGYSFNGDWDLGGAILTVLAAYNFSTTTSPLDLDNTAVAAVTNNFNNFVEYETKTSEIQLVSDNDSRFKWVVGANYYHEDSFLTNPFSSPPSVFGLFVYTAPYAEYNAEAFGVFANAEYKFTDKLSAFAGVRYNNDKKAIGTTNIQVFDQAAIPDPSNVLAIPRNPNGFTLFEEDANFSNVNFRAGANYFLLDELMVYGSIATGYRPGGFNADSTETSLYNEETTLAYEIGVKSTTFDRRLMLNVSAFLTDYKDRQESLTIGVPAFGPDGQQIGVDFRSDFTNVPESQVYGLEVESSFKLTDNLLIDFSLGYLNAEVTSDFIGVDQFRPELGLATNFKGNKLAWTPEWKYNVGVQYEHELSGNLGSLTARVDYAHSDQQFSEYFNRTPANTSTRPQGVISNLVPAYETLNFSASWRMPMQGLTLEALVTNVLDEDDITSIKPAFQASAGTNTNWVTYREPRFYSLKLTKEF